MRPHGEPVGTGRAGSDFHLVESPDGWTLTISLSSRMLDALMGDDSPSGSGNDPSRGGNDPSRGGNVPSRGGNEQGDGSDGRSVSDDPAGDDASSRALPKFTVHVEPNLVSGQPFDARVVVVRPPL